MLLEIIQLDTIFKTVFVSVYTDIFSVSDLLFMCGGYPVQHAFAQEDSWNKVLNFLKRELGT